MMMVVMNGGDDELCDDEMVVMMVWYGNNHVNQYRNEINTYCSPRIYVGESILSSLGSLVTISRTE